MRGGAPGPGRRRGARPQPAHLLLATGPLSSGLVGGAIAAGMPAAQARYFISCEELTESLRADIRPADLVLVKASRGIGLDEVVDALISSN